MNWYRLKPKPVQAVQFVSGKPKAIRDFCPDARPVKYGNKVEQFLIGKECTPLDPGDWLTREPGGCFEVYTPKDFEDLYEKLPDRDLNVVRALIEEIERE